METKAQAKKCMSCGKCSAACPSFPEMDIRPHKFIRYAAEENTEALSKSETLWKCLSCFACAEKCPRGVDASAVVTEVKHSVVRRQGGDYLSQDDIPGLIENDEEVPQQLIVAAMRKYRG